MAFSNFVLTMGEFNFFFFFILVFCQLDEMPPVWIHASLFDGRPPNFNSTCCVPCFIFYSVFRFSIEMRKKGLPI